MAGSVLRAVVLVAGLLATTATSVRSPFYPRVGIQHQGTVYVHNATDAMVQIEVTGERHDRAIDCDALTAGKLGSLSREQFGYAARWDARPGENIPLWDAQRQPPARPCHAVLVQIENQRWIVTWGEGNPVVHGYPHVSKPGLALTSGGIRAAPGPSGWSLQAPEAVTTTRLNKNQHKSLFPQVGRDKSAPDDVGVGIYAAAGSVSDSEKLGDTELTFSMDFRMRGMAGGPPGLTGGTDLEMGSTADGGLLYSTTLYPIGLGGHWRSGAAGVIVGGGLSGITGDRSGFAWHVPVEAYVSLDLSRRLRINAWSRLQWIFREDPRQNGSANAPIGDELYSGLSVDLLWPTNVPGFRRGVSMAFTYRELHDTEIIGFALGGVLWSTSPD